MTTTTDQQVDFPAAKAKQQLAALDDTGRARFEAELLALAQQHNTASDGTLRIPSEYLEVVVTVR